MMMKVTQHSTFDFWKKLNIFSYVENGGEFESQLFWWEALCAGSARRVI